VTFKVAGHRVCGIYLGGGGHNRKYYRKSQSIAEGPLNKIRVVTDSILVDELKAYFAGIPSKLWGVFKGRTLSVTSGEIFFLRSVSCVA
jgi:hypothetical protein